ncbi:MAG: prepilin-type N-terminal cleavage/methylation domain-containing protein [Deltaproteobacteria bacterium]|nr:prepilin-type N-terminal cleavage/methylation domain-containing protein [Deltaproteobacteria bacterium]
MTLIELLVTMAIVGIMFGVAAVSFSNLFDLEMKGAAKKLASTMRYLRNKAVTERVYLRVVYNIDESAYLVESTKDPFVVQKEEPQEKKEPEEGEEAPPEAQFIQEEGLLLKPVKLPDGVFFKDVWMSLQGEKKTNGKGYTYFFPNGFMTGTIINLRDKEEETFYSIEVEPYSGHVIIRSEYKEGEGGAR